MSRGFIGWSQTTRMLAGGVSGFILGRLLDRHGARLLIAVASITTGACMIGLFFVQNSWQFLGLFTLMGFIGLSAPGGLLTSVPVAKWFVQHRGARAGYSDDGVGDGRDCVHADNPDFHRRRGLAARMADAGDHQHGAHAAAGAYLPAEAAGGHGTAAGRTGDRRPTNPTQPPPREEAQWTAGQAMRTKTFWRLIVSSSGCWVLRRRADPAFTGCRTGWSRASTPGWCPSLSPPTLRVRR